MALNSKEKPNRVVEVEFISDLMHETMIAINGLRKECSVETLSKACDVLDVGTQSIDMLYNGRISETRTYEQGVNYDPPPAHTIAETQPFIEYEESFAEQLSDVMNEYPVLESDLFYSAPDPAMEKAATRALLVRTLEQRIANKVMNG